MPWLSYVKNERLGSLPRHDNDHGELQCTVSVPVNADRRRRPHLESSGENHQVVINTFHSCAIKCLK